jgi:hypothetical protein
MRFIFAFIILLTSVLSFAPTAMAKAPCKMLDAKTLSLQSYIEKELLPCVKALDLSTLETVVLNTGGGDVETAIKVGDLIAPHQPHMIIKKRCHSSCSNYWLPLARKITFEKKARILIHGGIDPAILQRTALKEGRDASVLQGLVDMQDGYLTRHKIPRGWVMYRDRHFKGGSWLEPWLVGTHPKLANPKHGIKFLMVTKPMLSSCLPDIELIGYDLSYAARADRKKWVELGKKGQVSSGSLVCPAETVVRDASN